MKSFISSVDVDMPMEHSENLDSIANICDFIRKAHAAYTAHVQNAQSDCRHIVQICGEVVSALISLMQGEGEKRRLHWYYNIEDATMMKMTEIVDYIYSIPKFTKKGGLSQTAQIMALFGHPENDFPYIHIAGTNGKGSVSAYMSGMLGWMRS